MFNASPRESALTVRGELMPDCKACTERGKPENYGSDPKCAFRKSDRLFNNENWNCATLNELRDLISDVYERNIIYSSDESLAVIPLHDSDLGDFLVTSWYKSRGRTHTLVLFRSEATMLPNLQTVESIISELKG